MTHISSILGDLESLEEKEAMNVSSHEYVWERLECDAMIDYYKIWRAERESETGRERIGFLTVERESDL